MDTSGSVAERLNCFKSMKRGGRRGRACTPRAADTSRGLAADTTKNLLREKGSAVNASESQSLQVDGSDDEVLQHGLSPPQTAPATIQFGAINASNIEMLRKLNTHIFPVRYNDTFYGDVLFVPKGYAKFAYWDGLVVGAICCRHEPVDGYTSRLRRTYVMTLGVLEPYRHYNIGSAMLQSVIHLSHRDGVDHIYLHVQTSNDAALRFYRNFGFEVRDTIRNYYKRLHPPDCFVLAKKLNRNE